MRTTTTNGPPGDDDRFVGDRCRGYSVVVRACLRRLVVRSDDQRTSRRFRPAEKNKNTVEVDREITTQRFNRRDELVSILVVRDRKSVV